jgi:CspA family cold shock protein
MNGQVRNVNERGFALIRGTDDEDYFLHASQLIGIAFQELRQHDTVSFQPADGPPGKGPIATNAERVKRAPGFSNEVERRADPAHGRWPTATGRMPDDEETAYDWDQAG